VFASSPFYASAGGQAADMGTVENLSRQGTARVVDVTKNSMGVFLHRVEVTDGAFEAGDRCRLMVDVERRRRIERNHTATHLLHAALRQVLGTHAQQAGSEVNDRELRFDFAHFEKMSREQIARVEEIANAAVLADLPVETEEMPLERAQQSGAIGLFEDEYRGRDRVRVVRVGTVSKEFCGGTHVRRSGEIGLVRIVSEESIASGVRRIRAITGDAVLAELRKQQAALDRLRAELGDDLEAGLAKLRQRLEELEAQLAVAGARQVEEVADSLLGTAEIHGKIRLIAGRADLSADQLKGGPPSFFLWETLRGAESQSARSRRPPERSMPGASCELWPGSSAVEEAEGRHSLRGAAPRCSS
jgi:alanyl-tRNA synthetase